MPSPLNDLERINLSKVFWIFFSKFLSIKDELGSTTICGFNPRSLLVKSDLKPFMTDITIIRIATPSIIPKNEKIDISLRKPSLRFGFKFL